MLLLLLLRLDVAAGSVHGIFTAVILCGRIRVSVYWFHYAERNSNKKRARKAQGNYAFWGELWYFRNFGVNENSFKNDDAISLSCR